MHSNVTRNLYESRKRAGLLNHSTFFREHQVERRRAEESRTLIVTMDMVVRVESRVSNGSQTLYCLTRARRLFQTTLARRRPHENHLTTLCTLFSRCPT